METSVQIVADSLSPKGIRLTTMEVVLHRFVLAEFNTHRVFSRNSASSRAIPYKTTISKVQNNPALPLSFGTLQPGMQSGPPLTGDEEKEAIEIWLEAAQSAVDAARKLNELGVHKEVGNRILEPFLWHTVIVSSTEWDNFFSQRDSELAQPEIAAVARLMKSALQESKPSKIPYTGWHLPYLAEDEKTSLTIEEKRKVSVARCTRVSFLNHGGKRELEKDIELYDKLLSADPPHWSPLEHVATPAESDSVGNFSGWAQLRHLPWHQ